MADQNSTMEHVKNFFARSFALLAGSCGVSGCLCRDALQRQLCSATQFLTWTMQRACAAAFAFTLCGVHVCSTKLCRQCAHPCRKQMVLATACGFSQPGRSCGPATQHVSAGMQVRSQLSCGSSIAVLQMASWLLVQLAPSALHWHYGVQHCAELEVHT
jgi:hypothetical protein